MSTVIATLIAVSMLLSGIGLLTSSSVHSADTLNSGLREMEAKSREIANTRIEVLSTSHSGQNVDITLKNAGQVALLEFSAWDVVVQYESSGSAFHEKWVPYTSANPPGTNQWTVTGIYKTATSESEVFQPNIFNPGEEMVIRIKLSPSPTSGGDHVAIIGTSNGVSIATIF